MDPMTSKPPPSNMLRYATVGLEFFLVFVLFLFLGRAVDQWLGWSSPGFTVLGGIVGFAVAFWRITRQGWGIMTGGRRMGRQEKGDDQE